MKHSGIVAAAIELLQLSLHTPQPADHTARAYFKTRRYMGSKDRKKIAEYVFQTFRFKSSLSWWVTHISTQAGEGLNPTPRMLVLTLLAVHEGLALHDIAHLCAETPYGPGALQADEHTYLQALQARTTSVDEMPLHARWDVPAWTVAQFEAAFGAATPDAMAAMVRNAPLDVRINTLTSCNQEAEDFFNAHDISFEKLSATAHGYRLARGVSLSHSDYFQKGGLELQDLGSQMIVDACGAAPGMHILDYCAGAGGKTLALAAHMQGQGVLVASDLSAARLRKCQDRLQRAQARNVLLQDASTPQWHTTHTGYFDRVLVDAPCSGSGTWRRNPDLKWRTTPQDIAQACATQQAILDQVAPLIKAGGQLIYATCSLWHEENEGQVQAFLQRHPAFTQRQQARLSPHTSQTDGFYYAVLMHQGG